MEKLQVLKKLADVYKLKYHHNIGEEKLEEQLKLYCLEQDLDFDEQYTIILDTFQDTEDDVIPDTTETKKVKTKEKLSEYDSYVDRLANLTFIKGHALNKETNLTKRMKEANKLIRCIVHCNNPNKSSYESEIFCVQNKYTSEIKKLVAFGVPWHVPQMLLNTIKERQYQVFYDKKSTNGIPHKETKMMPEYTVQILPPISTEEYNSIRQKQLAEGYNGE